MRTIDMSFAAALLVASVLITTTSSGQWSQIDRLPHQSQDSDNGGSPLYNGGGDPVIAANGDILVFYAQNGAFTNFPDGTPAMLKMMRSTDNGATWNEPVVLLVAANDDVQGFGPPFAAVNPTSGRITLVFYSQSGSDPGFVTGDETWHSDDNGQTWTRAGVLTDFAFFAGAIEYTPNGTLVYSYGRSSGGDQLVSRKSTDDGATWSAPVVIDSPATSICSHSLAALSDTDYLAFWSNCFFGAGGTTTLTALTSTDGGATWSGPTEVLTRGSGFLTALELLHASDNTLWLTYTDGSSLYYRTSADNGVTWSDGIQWTLGDNEGNVECTDLPGGPLCVFLAIGRAADTMLSELFIGQLGVSVDPRLTVGTEDVGAGVPDSFTLSQNYPNPFNPGTTISFELNRPQHVQLTLHDALGRRIRVLTSESRPAGTNNVTVDGSGLSSGVYLYRLQTEDGTAARVMTVMK